MSFSRLFGYNQIASGSKTIQSWLYRERAPHIWEELSLSLILKNGDGQQEISLGEPHIPEGGDRNKRNHPEAKAPLRPQWLVRWPPTARRAAASRGWVAGEQVELPAQRAAVLGHLLAAVEFCAGGVAFALFDKGVHLGGGGQNRGSKVCDTEQPQGQTNRLEGRRALWRPEASWCHPARPYLNQHVGHVHVTCSFRENLSKCFNVPGTPLGVPHGSGA